MTKTITTTSTETTIWEILTKFEKYDELAARFYTNGVRFDVLKFEGVLTVFSDQEEILAIHDSIQYTELSNLNFSDFEIQLITLFNKAWDEKFTTKSYKKDYPSRIAEHIEYISKKYSEGYSSVRTEIVEINPFGDFLNIKHSCLRIKDLSVLLIDPKYSRLGTDRCSNKYGYRLIQDDEFKNMLNRNKICRESLEIIEEELAEISGTMLPTI